MKRLPLVFFLLIPFLSVHAQTMDGELKSLISFVCELRDADQQTYDNVRKKFINDNKWTPMNETGNLKEGECRPYDNVAGFKLNRLLTLVAGDRKYVSVHGDMLNGEDKRFNYSLYERSVHAGKTVDYVLMGRKERQWFVIVSYDTAPGVLSATVKLPGRKPQVFDDFGGGVLAAYIDDPDIVPSMEITISVTGGRKDQSFVILNHNMGN